MKTLIGTSSGFVGGALLATALSLATADKGDLIVEVNPQARMTLAQAESDLGQWVLDSFGAKITGVQRFTCVMNKIGGPAAIGVGTPEEVVFDCSMVATMIRTVDEVEALQRAGDTLRVIGAVGQEP